MAVLKSVPVMWCQVLKPNTTFDNPAWEVQAVLTEAQAAALQAEAKGINKKGIKIKTDEKGVITYRFKRAVKRADGTENAAPVIVGSGGKGDTWPAGVNIGNGSVCNIQYAMREFTFGATKGVTVDLKGIQVLHHVPYGVADGDEFESEDNGEGTSASKAPADNEEFDDEDFS
jgi:hypothetical protein